MFDAQSGNFSEGSFQDGSFSAIQEYFQQRSCRHCQHNYSASGIELIREEPGILVVRVVCSHCSQPLGIALVGLTGKSGSSNSRKGEFAVQAAAPCRPSDWNRRDAERFADQKPIGFDDVIDAHNFFSNLGSDWQKHLPKIGRRRGRVLN